MQYVKCGFAGENFPTSVFPCVVGRPMLRYEESLTEQELKVCQSCLLRLLNYDIYFDLCDMVVIIMIIICVPSDSPCPLIINDTVCTLIAFKMN